MSKILSITFVLLFFFSACATNKSSLNKENRIDSRSNMQSKMLAYVNNIRQNGATCAAPASPLTYNSFLQKSAEAHARDMAINNKLSHTGSGTETDPAKKSIGIGSTYVERILYFGYPNKPGKLLGESLAFTKFNKNSKKDYYDHFKEAVKNLMNDTTHCKIIMNPRFSNVGMSMQRGKDGYYLVIDLGEKL